MSVDSIYQSADKPLSRLPQGGEAQTLLQLNFALANHHNHRRSAPFPFGKGGGIVPTDTPINHANQGEVPLTSTVSFLPRLFGLTDV